jgi:predicted glutamine amidotransferase
MTVATTDGESVWVFRYSSERKTRSLFFSTEVAKVRALYPEVELLHQLGPEARFVVSEPLRDLPGAWNEMPESSAGVVRPATTRSVRFSRSNLCRPTTGAPSVWRCGRGTGRSRACMQ